MYSFSTIPSVPGRYIHNEASDHRKILVAASALARNNPGLLAKNDPLLAPKGKG
jgi:hypothetical protein